MECQRNGFSATLSEFQDNCPSRTNLLKKKSHAKHWEEGYLSGVIVVRVLPAVEERQKGRKGKKQAADFPTFPPTISASARRKKRSERGEIVSDESFPVARGTDFPPLCQSFRTFVLPGQISRIRSRMRSIERRSIGSYCRPFPACC
ncbi:hypothetical protein CDAR_424471 [Caerostris darwini]|uniref:Uncharacterized protein n=1 Tax=Caerostris darwini TaxID=1538125 RepID=A0AAV4T6B4_9ARAC|nr:hypothetical protein CDAR_424471 [Caerostris darwini]